MPQLMVECFHAAVARNAAAVISLPAGEMLRHHKTRFLGQSQEGLWLQMVPAERELIERLIESGQPAGVSFRGGAHRIAFCSRILRWNKDLCVNHGTTVPAMLLALPQQLNPIQRRSCYRVRVPGDSDLQLRIWRVGDDAQLTAEPAAGDELPCIPRNISVGGIGVTVFPPQGRTFLLASGDRLRLELIYRAMLFVLEGRIRHVGNPTQRGAGARYVGIQFDQLEASLEGRQTLCAIDSIIAELQREEVRRMRLGMVLG